MKAGALFGASILLLFLSGCRTTGDSFRPLEPGDAAQVWQRLVAARREFKGARGFARIQAAERSFRATLTIRPTGSFELNVLSPIGTTVATMRAEGNSVTVTEGSERSTHTLAELAERLGLPVANWTAEEIGLLLVGLPPHDRFDYELSDSGIEQARSGGVEIRYDPAVFPPQKVTIHSGTDQFELEYLELRRL